MPWQNNTYITSHRNTTQETNQVTKRMEHVCEQQKLSNSFESHYAPQLLIFFFHVQ